MGVFKLSASKAKILLQQLVFCYLDSPLSRDILKIRMRLVAVIIPVYRFYIGRKDQFTYSGMEKEVAPTTLSADENFTSGSMALQNTDTPIIFKLSGNIISSRTT